MTVVVAVWNDTAGLRRCLEALAAQVDDDTDVLIVANLPEEPDRTAGFGWATWIEAPESALVPVLWSRGIERARGELVALTTAHFAPQADWLQETRDAAARHDAVGIGGAIDPPRSGGAVAWATYYLRYSNYFHMESERVVREIAGDNAVYRREALMRHRDAIADGFWEPDFHRLVHAEGETLVYVPSIRVTQVASFHAGSFCHQRFHHGTQFGSSRVRGRGRLERAVRLASVPAVPFVFLAKICRRAAHRPRDLPSFLRALPVLVTFVLCWTAGEARGYLRG